MRARTLFFHVFVFLLAQWGPSRIEDLKHHYKTHFVVTE